MHINGNIEKSIRGKKAFLLCTGDKESAVLMHMAGDLHLNIVFVDTGFHFGMVMDYVMNLGGKIEIIKKTGVTVDHLSDPAQCCSQRKRQVLKEYLDKVGAECLVVPFRNEEKTSGREDSYLAGIERVQIIRPLADYTDRSIWMHIKENKLSVSKIYTKGYKTIDCKCCITRYGRMKQKDDNTAKLHKEVEEKLKALGYM